MDRDDVTSAGLTAIGMVAGTLARAVALGGRLVAAGLETLESALRSGNDGPDADREARTVAGRSTSRPARSAFAPVSEPAFEPADGVTSPARPPGTVTRRSSAGAAAQATPRPRPAKRATATSLPPNLRPVQPGERAPVKAAAGAADLDADLDRTPATKSPAKKAAARKAATTTPATTAAKKSTAKKVAAKKAAKKAADTPDVQAPAPPVQGVEGAADAATRGPDAGSDASPTT